MPIIVKKFGGTSVADAERIHRAARRAIRAQDAGRQVVLVVSAMGHETDRLVDLAKQVARKPARRELDMLLATGEQVSIALVAMAIHDLGREAVSLTGAQAGMLTDSTHTLARIKSIDTARLHGLLDAGKIVIVAGFQGVDPEANITTLGRGGSDTTAVALAAALEAETCEIYTDVEGVFTTDPRVVPAARKLDRISYDEMLEMASLGAGVMHGRSIELAMKFGVEIHVRSSFTDEPGTLIMAATKDMEAIAVRGATLKRDITRVTLAGLPNQPGIVAAIFDEIAQRGVFVDDIIQNALYPVPESGGAGAPNHVGGGAPPAHPVRHAAPFATLGFTVTHDDTAEVRAVAELIAQRFAVQQHQVQDGLARVGVVGVGMRSHRGVAATMFRALADAGVNIENITTSEIVISVLVHEAEAEKALRVVHQAFGLDSGAD